MKKYNADKICRVLHKNALMKEFKVEEDMVVYSGIDQVEPIKDAADFCAKLDELEKMAKSKSGMIQKKHKAGGIVEYILNVLKRRGWNVQAYLTIRQDGLVSVVIADNHHTKADLDWTSGEKPPISDFPEKKLKIKRNKIPAKATKKTQNKKKGVISTIIDSITNERKTHSEILEILINAFPERSPESMAKTIKVQVPNRIKKEKGLNITETKKGFKIE